MAHNISEKMYGLTQRNSAVRAMFEEGKRLAALYGPGNVHDFSIGNPNFPAPPQVNEAIADIVRSEPSTFVHGYMSNAGYEDVRGAIADRLNRRFGTDFGFSHIIMTAGAAGGLNVILKTLLNPGDEVAVIAPYFLEYGSYIANYDGVTVVVPPNPPDFRPDPAAVGRALTPKTKALILNSPNNPTGAVYSEKTLKGIAAALEEKAAEFGRPIYMISDEPYRELAYDGAEVPWLTSCYRNTIVCYSWSKSLSLPGERIGYIAVSPEADESALILEAAVIANRVLGFVNAPSLIQRVVMRCLDESADLSAYDHNRRLLYDGLKDAGFECTYPEGAFYLWVKTPCDDQRFCEMAKKHNILVVPGSAFACPGYIRIAYCVDPGTITAALPAFRRLAEDLEPVYTARNAV
ncbi:MAG: pyridoxal phosphate-dependent aminotransferase [Oscillospiraceae bacterium]|jgi:aspartate aminotransferase|nr:pyridoxal phosphate-dependent aminotransferase [Oscillospiraceae bacterium]